MLFRSVNFYESEFECPCFCKIVVTYMLIDKLQLLRDMINKPIEITSGYRCKQYNKSIGGYSHSPHLIGEAADIKVKDMSTVTLAMIASKIEGIRIGMYPNHIHIDVRPANPSRYWLVRKYGKKTTYSKGEKSLTKFLKNNLK